MRKSYIVLGVIGLAGGGLLIDTMADVAQSLIVFSVVLIIFGLTKGDTKIKARPVPSLQNAGVAAAPPPPSRDVRYCQSCGQPLSYIEQYGRWYCYSCEKYA